MEQPQTIVERMVSMVLVTFYSAVDEEIDCEELVADALRRYVEAGECQVPVDGWDIQVILEPTKVEGEARSDEEFGLTQSVKPPF